MSPDDLLMSPDGLPRPAGHVQRHGLTVVVVDGIAGLTLQFGAMTLALCATGVTLGAVDASAHVHTDDRTAVLATIGVLAWIIAATILLFIGPLR